VYRCYTLSTLRKRTKGCIRKELGYRTRISCIPILSLLLAVFSAKSQRTPLEIGACTFMGYPWLQGQNKYINTYLYLYKDEIRFINIH